MVRASLVPVLFRPRAFVPLTFTGDLITDAVRAAGVSGDGLLNDSSTGVWPAATNLIINGGFETNITGLHKLQGTETISRDTTEHKFGTASLKVITAGATNPDGFYQIATVVTSTTYTYSAWVKGASGSVAPGWADGLSGDSGAAVAMDGTWKRLSVTFTVTSPSVSVSVGIRTITNQSITYYVDGAQCELGAVATPYIETDGATASRAAGRIQVPNVAPYQLITAAQGAVATKLRMGFPASGSGLMTPRLIDQDNGSWAFIGLQYAVIDSKWKMWRGNGVQPTSALSDVQTFVVGDYCTPMGLWTPTTVYVAVNGGAFAGVASAAIPTLTVPLDFGSAGGSNAHLLSNIFTAVFWNDKSDLAAVQANPVLINALLTAGVTDLNAYPGNASGLWDGNSQFMEVRA